MLTRKVSPKKPKSEAKIALHRISGGYIMIVALEEAKRKLVALEDVLAELKNQLRIDEAKERAEELERETMVQDFWNDAEKSSKKLQEIKQLKDKVESYEELCAKLEDT